MKIKDTDQLASIYLYRIIAEINNTQQENFISITWISFEFMNSLILLSKEDSVKVANVLVFIKPLQTYFLL